MALTDQQQRMIAHRNGHAKIAAVAGSGKTTTMVEFSYQMVKAGVDPVRLGIFMFNRDAREEFQVRLDRRFRGSGKTVPVAKTLHSVGLKICQLFERGGHLATHRVESREWVQQELLGLALKSALGNSNQSATDLMDEFAAFVEKVKADTRSAEEVVRVTGVAQHLYRVFVRAFERYEQERIRRGLRFFSDMLWEPVQVMRNRPDLVALVANRYELIIVDEAQDMNPVQQRLLEYLAGTRASVVVVGDVDQCIYAWRGAEPEYLLEAFEKRFQPVETYQLSCTFRFGHRLSLMANHLIRHNKEREDTFCVSHADTPDTQVEVLWDDYQEGDHAILRTADHWIEQGRDWEELAILVRDNATATGLMLHLLARGVPFGLKGAIQFLGSRPYIDALLAVLEFYEGTLFRPDRLTRLTSLIRFPYSPLKQGECEDIARRCIETGVFEPLYRALRESSLQPNLAFKIERRFRFLEGMHEQKPKGGRHSQPGSMIRAILNTYVSEGVADYDGSFRWMAASQEALEQYRQVLKEFMDFMVYRDLPPGELVEEMDEFAERVKGCDHGITISTCHGAKGLEYPAVVLYGLEQGRFPNAQAPIEEERRLFYVAMTRAREQLYLVAPPDPHLKKALYEGATEKTGSGPASAFLFEIGLKQCDDLARCLEKEDYASIAELPAVTDASVFNRYLDRVLPEDCRTIRVREKPEEPNEAQNVGSNVIDLDGMGEKPQPKRIRHSKFGEGRVEKWRDGRYMYVVFKGYKGWFMESMTPYEVIE